MTDSPTEVRVSPHSYLVRPTRVDELPDDEQDVFDLLVVDGRSCGWAIRRRSIDSLWAMNRRGEWIRESRGSGLNRPRRWPLPEALTIALAHVDTQRFMGRTLDEVISHATRRATGA